MTTIADIRSLIGDLTRDPQNRIRTSPTVDRAINSAYEQIQQDLYGMLDADSETNINGTAGTGTYTMPSDNNFVEVIRRNGQVLKRTTRKEVSSIDTINNTTNTVTGAEYLVDTDGNYLIDSEGNFLTTTVTSTTNSPLLAIGTPTHYYLTNGLIGLYPVPDTSGYITITYSGLFSEVSSTNTALRTPPCCDNAIVYYATSLLNEQIIRLDVAKSREDKYIKEVAKCRLMLVKDENITYGYK